MLELVHKMKNSDQKKGVGIVPQTLGDRSPVINHLPRQPP